MTARLINVPEEQLEKPLVARIVSTDGAVNIERDFARKGEEWTLTTEPLPPNSYRVTVLTDENAADAPAPVHDIFVV